MAQRRRAVRSEILSAGHSSGTGVERFREDPPDPKPFSSGSASFAAMTAIKLAIADW
jgi:hypothetical protein